MANQKDPVCGMQVDEQNAAGQSQYQEQTYYFCSQSCKQKFDQNPQQYAGDARQSQTSGTNR
jgi:YHS domain-containing protein